MECNNYLHFILKEVIIMLRYFNLSCHRPVVYFLSVKEVIIMLRYFNLSCHRPVVYFLSVKFYFNLHFYIHK